MNELLKSVPDSYFASVNTLSDDLDIGEKPLINMAVGIPDGPAPDTVTETVKSAVDNPENHKYPGFRGRPEFKKAIIDFYRRHYGVELKDENIAILYGTKSMLVQFPMIFIEPGEGVYLPNPGYADYAAGVDLARGVEYELPLLEENDFLPDYDALKQEELDNARLIYLNYPSNPLGTVASKDFFDDTIRRFRDTGIKIVHDFAYAAFGYDNKHPSILQSDPEFSTSIEVYSFSKSYNMSGFRSGFAVGNKEMIEAINTYQDHTQTGMWGVLQEASIAALDEGDEFLLCQNEIFESRKEKVVQALSESGIPIRPIEGGIFGWIRVPEGFDGESFVTYLLKEQSILATPGIPFGSRGKDFIRISLAVEDGKLDECIERFKSIAELWK
ncbi:aminotransferase class I/II-fold pyridoxal phosphate-dependent enzyme [Salinicoccus halitifaciens]|uniref:Aspartate/methionine/tyrosine aminotransferase n=1 Tax=Salinicoccus halitifaciens TaxID=1073415 RepID=A0ABV2E6X9_9STAP|nr:aminotransferase class I/II-fold pyridoxal phosphate-dependent enzyme [Salinicoccus halitifaciens]MCD2136771.1 aminotransferase class I/II-fold pyridoxal phosphate-dependent enzyme [Salinicoccus halitifaciens]